MKFLFNIRREKVKDMCCTRWVERHEAFDAFIDLFMPITCCLEETANSSPTDWNSETRSDAQSFFVTIFRFSFVIALISPHRESLVICQRTFC